jgi:hypothetical protein
MRMVPDSVIRHHHRLTGTIITFIKISELTKINHQA